MIDPTQAKIMIVNDIDDMCESLWANAALPRVTGLVGKPEPEVSALTGDHPVSQEGDDHADA